MNRPRPRDTAPPRGVGPVQVARILLSMLFMIGRKSTWEGDGDGSRMTPRQFAFGIAIGVVLLVAGLVMLVRLMLHLAIG